MDHRVKEKERPAKNNLAAHSRKGEVQSRVAVLERGEHCNVRQESMESTCGGPIRHLGARGWVKVKVKFVDDCVTILAVYNTIYENASKIALNAKCRK